MPLRGDKVKPKYNFNKGQIARLQELDKLLAAKGFDTYSRAGILGNAFWETRFTLDPNIKNHLGYKGLWLNSAAILKAIIDQYGDYSQQSQLRFLDDWVSGVNWVRKGKHRDHTALYSGSFKKAGYKNAQEASEAFLKLYERAVIKDKNGKVIGYQHWDERNNYANLIYDLLYGLKDAVVPNLVEDIKKKEWKPQTVLKPVVQQKQDYPIQVEAPLSINAYNMPDSPSYTTRPPDIQLLMNAVMSDQYVPQYVPILTTNQVQPVLNVILPDGNKTMLFSGFRYGKLPIYPKYII